MLEMGRGMIRRGARNTPSIKTHSLGRSLAGTMMMMSGRYAFFCQACQSKVSSSSMMSGYFLRIHLRVYTGSSALRRSVSFVRAEEKEHVLAIVGVKVNKKMVTPNLLMDRREGQSAENMGWRSVPYRTTDIRTSRRG